jgi:hypothetical protein
MRANNSTNAPPYMSASDAGNESSKTAAINSPGANNTAHGTFVTAGDGGLSRRDGLVFGPDGDLYVASMDTRSVLRYDGTTGAFLGPDPFASLDFPHGIAPSGLAFFPVPEPTTIVLSLSGAALVLLVARRRLPFSQTTDRKS